MADVAAGPWASQAVAVSLYSPIFAGEALVTPLFGVFVGRFWVHFTDEELWREHTKRYRAFLYAITALATVYTLMVMEEVCYWGSKSLPFPQSLPVTCAELPTSPIPPLTVSPRHPALQQRSAEVMLRGHAMSAVVPPLGGLISALVSATLAHRASRLFTSRGPKCIFLAGVGSLICTSFAGALLVMYNTVRVSKRAPGVVEKEADTIFLQYLRDEEATTSFTFNNSISLWMATSAAADVSISVALWVTLGSQVGAGFEVTDSILRTVS